MNSELLVWRWNRRLRHHRGNTALLGLLGSFVAALLAVLYLANVFSGGYFEILLGSLCLLNAFLFILTNWLEDYNRSSEPLITLNLAVGTAFILIGALGI